MAHMSLLFWLKTDQFVIQGSPDPVYSSQEVLHSLADLSVALHEESGCSAGPASMITAGILKRHAMLFS